VASLLRRAAPEGTALEADGLRMDLESRKVSLGSREVALSMKEFELLHLLLSHRNKALSRQFILQEVWGYGAGIDVASRVVDVTLGHLRDKLGAWGKKVTSVRGLGYRLDLLS
jgi:two-component system alkaline phosphatase synthesis response regulator PhoP